jgi:hypothetical protein
LLYLNLDEVVFNPQIKLPQGWEHCDRNPFINSYKDNKIGLAEDMINNGIYVPFKCIVYDNEYCVKGGVHRIESLKLYQRTYGNVKIKLPTLIVPYYKGVKSTIKKGDLTKLNSPKRVSLMSDFMDKVDYINFQIVEELDEHSVVIEVYTLEELLKAAMVNTLELNDLIFDYNKNNEDKIAPAKLFNIEDTNE